MMTINQEGTMTQLTRQRMKKAKMNRENELTWATSHGGNDNNNVE
jgi:hypothetical protein